MLLLGANEHDVRVAPPLLEALRYTIVTADKGDLSRALGVEASHAVELVTPRRCDQPPPPKREYDHYKGRRIVQSTVSSLDRLGLPERPYRSNKGFVLHLYTTLLAFGLGRSGSVRLWCYLFRIEVLYSALGSARRTQGK